MDVMTAPTLGPGHTREDYYALPEDGPRYELIEGELVMAASPTWDHQRVVKRLVRVLDDACPEGLEVLPAPFDVDLEEHSIVEPDVLVFDVQSAEQRAVIGPPRLVVEVLSPSTRSYDQVRKMRLYERTAVPSYWIVDPSGDVSLTAWELRDGPYEPVAAVAGREVWTTNAPYDVTVVPADLLR